MPLSEKPAAKKLIMYYLAADPAISSYKDAVNTYMVWTKRQTLNPRQAGAIQRSVALAKAHVLHKKVEA